VPATIEAAGKGVLQAGQVLVARRSIAAAVDKFAAAVAHIMTNTRSIRGYRSSS